MKREANYLRSPLAGAGKIERAELEGNGRPALSLVGSLASRSCPLCGTSEFSRLLADANLDERQLDGFSFSSRKTPEFMHYRLMECSQCDLVYACQSPSVEFLAGAYKDADFSSAVEAEYASRTYASFVARLLPRLPDRSGALDIGTGDGCFLDKLIGLGFTEVCGVEPSFAPIQAARPEIRGLIRHGLFDPHGFGSERFSLITCFQTVEHVSDPLQLVSDAWSLLKPGGALVLICHNRRGIVNKVLGSRSPIRDIEHFQLFSPRSAERLLKAADFTSVQISTIVNRYPLTYWLRLLPVPAALKAACIDAACRSRIGSTAIPLPVGNLAATAFRP